jgi:hypothetical protein
MDPFEGPIPGESLTAPPNSFAWEEPPQFTDPEDALMHTLDTLTSPEKIDAMVNLLENGVDIQTLTEGILRFNVSEGIHDIDVGMVIAPIVHEYIKTTAEMVGIDYKDGFEREPVDIKGMAQAKSRSMKIEPKDFSAPKPPEVTVPNESSQGFMSRRKP